MPRSEDRPLFQSQTPIVAVVEEPTPTVEPETQIEEVHVEEAREREPHGVDVGGSQVYDTSKKNDIIVVQPSFTTQPTVMGVRGQTADTKPMDIDPFVETFVMQPSDMGIRGQTEEAKSQDVTVIKPEVREGIIQALTTTREDILHGQGLELPPKTLAETLVEHGPFGEIAAGVAVAPIENLMLVAGKYAKIPVMEKVKYNPTAIGLPIHAASSFYTSVVTGQPIERSGVSKEQAYLSAHPIYAA